MEKMVNRRWTT